MYLTFKQFTALSKQEKVGLLKGFTISESQWQDEKHLYQLAVARNIMDEDRDVLKRLANS